MSEAPDAAPSRAAPSRQTVVVVPPHLGYGSEEDSLASLALQPMPPRKDWAKIRAFDGVVLRFHAAFAEPKTVPDRTRRQGGEGEGGETHAQARAACCRCRCASRRF